MEGSSPSIEEERTATFYVYHPCYFLQQALRALLKCVDDPITNSPTHKSSPDAADPPSTTNQTIDYKVCDTRRSGLNYPRAQAFRE
ncbi:uncharacterized protein LOC114370661 isoform X2 [Glycine soja]|uniref:uncharacterized protein LOC114370661 isoform X2 n=1 Tax=Glycine soja TaxID=3848 RepID=UPI0010408150|nr:uncharacterized protein LOC114370661 isoform X2 [Glycine soja]